MGSITNDERECFHTLDERLGVVLAKILTQCQTVLVDQWVIQLSFRADRWDLTRFKVIFPNLEKRELKYASEFDHTSVKSLYQRSL